MLFHKEIHSESGFKKTQALSKGAIVNYDPSTVTSSLNLYQRLKQNHQRTT